MENEIIDGWYISNLKELHIKFIDEKVYKIDVIISSDLDLNDNDTSYISIRSYKFYPILKKYFNTRILIKEVLLVYDCTKELCNLNNISETTILKYNANASIDSFRIENAFDCPTEISFTLKGNFYV